MLPFKGWLSTLSLQQGCYQCEQHTIQFFKTCSDGRHVLHWELRRKEALRL